MARSSFDEFVRNARSGATIRDGIFRPGNSAFGAVTSASPSGAPQWDETLRQWRISENEGRTGTSPLSSLASPLTPPGNASPFTAETLVRNPELASILKKLYGDIGSLSTDPNRNQTVLHRNIKSPEVEAAAQGTLKTQQADAQNNAQSIADFAKSYLAAQPAAEATAAEEAGAIGRLYSGDYAKQLENIRRRSGVLSTQNLQRRLGALSGASNLNELGRGGVFSSNAQANLMRAIADASLGRDMAFADQERADAMDVIGRQTGAAGLRQRIIDAVLQRPLTPIQAGQSVAANDQNRLAQLASLITGNSVFTPQSQQELLGNVLNLYRGAAGLDPAAYYRYVRGDLPSGMEGVVPQRNYGFPSPNAGGPSGPSFDDIINALRAGQDENQPSVDNLEQFTPPPLTKKPMPGNQLPGIWDWQADRRNRLLREQGFTPNNDAGSPIPGRDFSLFNDEAPMLPATTPAGGGGASGSWEPTPNESSWLDI